MNENEIKKALEIMDKEIESEHTSQYVCIPKWKLDYYESCESLIIKFMRTVLHGRRIIDEKLKDLLCDFSRKVNFEHTSLTNIKNILINGGFIC